MNEPEALSGDEALALARKGWNAWNTWAAKNEGRAVDFSMVNFTTDENQDISFQEFIFPGDGNFLGAEMSDANFLRATFKGLADFSSVPFRGFTNFALARFEGGATFNDANFIGVAVFSESAFDGAAVFSDITVNTAVFSGATFTGPVLLEGCKFRVVPDFRRCEFAKHVTLDGVHVDFRAPEEGDADKYRRLKELAVAARDHDREQYFFACELKAKRGFETRGLALVPNYLYEWTSDFGRSLARPTLWLGIVWFGFGDHYRWVADKDFGHLWDGLLFSAAQLLPFLGASRGILADAKAALFGSGSAPLSGWVNSLTMIEGALGIVFLFLIGLALRNRFRI